MAKDEVGGRVKWGLIVLTGIVSLVVGIIGGVAVKYFTEKSGQLTYDVTALQVFPSQTKKIGIIAVRVSNTGKKEVEDVHCRVTLEDAEITEAALSPAMVPVLQSPKFAEFTIPFLNPAESVSLQLLVQPTSDGLKAPQVDLRGKGTVGQVKTAAAAGLPPSVLGIVAAAFSAILAMSTILRLWFRRRSELIPDQKPVRAVHSDDQRDILAFILGASDFHEDAAAIRNATRKRSYWSICDELTEKWLATKDLSIMERGIVALERCLDYAAIADSSKRLVQLDIARLALGKGDAELAIRHMKCARKEGDEVVEKRIAFDEALQELAKDQAT